MTSLLHLLLGPLPLGLFMLSVSAVYFARNKGSSIGSRLASSAHGFLGVVLFVGAIAVWELGYSSDTFLVPYGLLFLLPFGSIVHALGNFKGNRWLHLLQLPNALCLLAAGFVGGMAVTNDWL